MNDDESGRTLVCSVLFLDLIEYSKRAVSEQHDVKQVFNRALGEALDLLQRRDRVVVDTGDGAAVVFLGDPEDAMITGLAMREHAPRIAMRMGINLGPVRLMNDLNDQINVIGDGINVAQRVMSFASAGQLLVSQSYFEVVSRVSEHYRKLFWPLGRRQDKHVREHEIYVVDDSVRLGEPAHDGLAAAKAPAAEERAKVVDAGESMMVSGSSRRSVEAAVRELVARGATVLSAPTQVGGKWFAACTGADGGGAECTVENVGFKRLICGPTRGAVERRVAELVAFGARLEGEISQVGGQWTAVCDTDAAR